MQAISAQDIVDTVQEGLVVLDSQLTVVSANRRFFSLFSVTPEEVVGRHIYELGDGDWDTKSLRQLLEEILPEQRAVEAFEVDHHFPRVGRRIVHLNARKVFREGNHVEHILMTFYDVTDARLEQIQAARSAAILQSIVDTVRDPLVILDQDLRITSASRNFVELFGDAEAAVIGKRIDQLKQGQWDVSTLTSLLERVVPDETPFDNFRVEDDFPRLGHKIFNLNARKIFVPGNHVSHLLLAFEDVTGAVAEERYKEMMAAELAHRIKNSLAVISAFVAFEMRRAAAPCIDGYQAMQTRINAVASLYDVIAQSSAFGPVDIQSYLNGIANNIRSSLIGLGGDIAVQVDAEALAINADHAVPIGLLVNELATNAVKYAFPDGKGLISLTFRRRDGEVLLAIEDNGVGIDGAISREGSTGMGTRFVDAFVRQIGGTLARASSVKGTMITVRLPATVLHQ